MPYARSMSKRLADVLVKHWEPVKVRVCCRACGDHLGDYEFVGSTDSANSDFYPPRPLRRSMGSKGGPRHDASRFSIEPYPGGRSLKHKWRCRCGATPEKRADRWGPVEVVEGKVPRVYV